MTKSEFFEKVQSIIEDAVMSAQDCDEIAGIPYTEMDAAMDITALVPEYIWEAAAT